MTAYLDVAALVVGAYLLGGVPFGLLVARARGVDIRQAGSGNVGATNVGRVLGRRWGVLVFLLDTGKGAISTVVAGLLIARHADLAPTQRDLVWVAAGAACVIGSIAPVWLQFRGGKGVAASFGALVGIYPFLTWSALGALLVWWLVVKSTRYVSLASMVAACSLPVWFAGLSKWLNWGLDNHYPLLGLCVLLALVVLIRHRENIARLSRGAENKLGRG